jgi:hypothetical protein
MATERELVWLAVMAAALAGALWNFIQLIREYKPPRGPPRIVTLPESKHARPLSAPDQGRQLYVPDDRPILIRRLDRSPHLRSTVAGQPLDEGQMVARKKIEGSK